MKFRHCISFLFLLFSPSLLNITKAQNIRNDTIYVSTESAVELVFRSRSDGKLPRGDGSFEVKDGKNTSLVIRALKKEVTDQPLEVIEGKRMHKFILSYKDVVPASRIDWSDLKKLKVYVSEQDKKLSKEIDDVNKLYDQAKSDGNNQALWENIALSYQRLLNSVDAKDAGLLKSRLDETRRQLEGIREKKFNEAIKEGQNHFSSKNYSQAREAYSKAKEINPGDRLVSNYIDLTDSVWARDYVDKGDEAMKSKKYVLAKTNYQEAMKIKPGYPSLQNKYNQVKKDADPLIYKIEKDKGDQAFRVNNIEEARRAYDSAWSVKPGDADMKKRIEKVAIEEGIIEAEEKKVAEYQGLLETAKSLGETASTAQEYDLAIAAYERALLIIPTRKFPRKKIGELTKKKNGVVAN